MTGPEHYLKAEELLAEAVALVEEHAGQVMTPSRVAAIEAAAAQLRQAAQVHATLALAAATALADGGAGAPGHGMSSDDYNAWFDVASVLS